MPSEILIVAAEASSELYASRIIEEATRRKLPVTFYGIGSQRMASLGCDIIEQSEKMAVVGLWEVLAHFDVISKAFRNLVIRAKTKAPKAALLLDYPDFNMRLAKKLHGLKIPVLYFISPQVWAWRQNRVYTIKKIISKMLVVFPFEVEFYKKFGVAVSFVGHPLLDECKKQKLSDSDRTVQRGQLGVNSNEFLIGLLPGSRHSELKYNLQNQLKAAEIVAQSHSQARFILLVAPPLDLDYVKSLIPHGLKVSIRIIKDDPFRILQICDACLVASGTATLLTGLAQTPMVIMYRMNAMTGFLAKRLVKGPEFFGMANLILGERVVPELFQEEANPQKMAFELGRYIDSSEYRDSVRKKLSLIPQKLGAGGTIERVVDEIEQLING